MKDQSKPSILHVIQTLGPGGAERLLVTYLSNPVLKNEFNHIVVLTAVRDVHKKCQETFLVNAMEDIGVEVIGTGSPGPRNLLKSIFRLRKIIKTRNIRLVHSHLIWSNIAGRMAGRLSKIPVISSFHNSDYDPQVVASFTAPRWKQNFIKWLDGITARNCDSISIAVSHYVARHVHEHLRIQYEKMEVVHNPVDLTHIKPTLINARQNKRELLGIANGSKIIVSVGRVTDQKGFIELVEAFDQLCAEIPEFHLNLVIIGALVDSNYLSKLKIQISQASSKDRIHLTGAQADIGNWLAAADQFVFPSKFEGLGIALAEAMGVGLPCVATNIGPIPELIENEKTGLLVEMNDQDQLVKAMKKLIIDEEYAHSLGKAASKFIFDHFNENDKSAQLYHIYKRLIDF
ncbi:MAG: glycosyltransferase family 4 protein [bacterium]